MEKKKGTKRRGSAVTSVSCSQSFMDKMNEYQIRPSDAFKRGLKIMFDEHDGLESPLVMKEKIEKMSQIIESLNNQLAAYKAVKGELDNGGV